MSALGSLQEVGVEPPNSEELCDLEFTNNVMCLFDCTEHALDRLGTAIALFVM